MSASDPPSSTPPPPLSTPNLPTPTATATTTATTTPSGRGGRHGRTGRSSSGRTPIGGRTLAPTHGRGRGGQRSAPVSVHSGSGVPFGHVPAYLPGSASLVEELDKRILIVLRDGRHLIGTLATFDQFSNLVLKNAVERFMTTVRDKNGMSNIYYADNPQGLFSVRGDSMVLCGQLHEDTSNMQKVTVAEFAKLKSDEKVEWDFDGDLIA